MLLDRLKKIDFRKGGASLLELSITTVLLASLLLIIVGLFTKKYTTENVNLLADQMARKIVVCSSLDEAEQYIDDNKDVFDMDFVEDMEIYIDYVPGGEEVWKKGNFINITFHGKINSISAFTDTTYNVTITKMIEHN